MADGEARYAAVADGFEGVLREVRADQWACPTPCDEWDTSQLVDHVIATHRRTAATLGTGAAPSSPEGSDRLEAWLSATTKIREALRDPATATTMVHTPRSERTFQSLVAGLPTVDTLCHTWDLARAIGADETLGPEAVARCDEALRPVGDAPRAPGGFGAARARRRRGRPDPLLELHGPARLTRRWRRGGDRDCRQRSRQVETVGGPTP